MGVAAAFNGGRYQRRDCNKRQYLAALLPHIERCMVSASQEVSNDHGVLWAVRRTRQQAHRNTVLYVSC